MRTDKNNETKQELPKIQKYAKLFSKDEKAKAFDKLAALYYQHNFGSASKSEIDLLMFSLLFDKLLEKNKDNEDAYSPYELSKLLCVPQSRITTLKTRKQLKYPYIGKNWKENCLQSLRMHSMTNVKSNCTLRTEICCLKLKMRLKSKADILR